MEIRGPGSIVRGTSARLRLYVRNEEAFEQWYGTGANVEGSYPWFHGRINPESQLFSVPARAGREIPFDLIIGEETAPGGPFAASERFYLALGYQCRLHE